jgi:hypothetical protein
MAAASCRRLVEGEMDLLRALIHFRTWMQPIRPVNGTNSDELGTTASSTTSVAGRTPPEPGQQDALIERPVISERKRPGRTTCQAAGIALFAPIASAQVTLS